MDALILAAGRGERMRPLTDRTPKPLLTAGGQSLIERHVLALTGAGIRHLVVNHAHLGEQIVAHLGTGSRFGASVCYSPEPPGALDTGGGIVNALRLLDSDPFLVVNGDIWTDFDFRTLPGELAGQAWLVLVNNPPHHPGGDFRLHHGLVLDLAADQGTALTFSGIGLYRRALFADLEPGKFPLAPILRRAIASGEVHGLQYTGAWYDVGTPARLETLQRRLAAAT